MSPETINSLIEGRMWLSFVNIGVLVILEILTLQKAAKPTEEKRDWQLDKEKEDNDDF